MWRFIIFLSLILAVRLVFFYIFQDQSRLIRTNPRTNITVIREVKDHFKSTYRSALNPKDADFLMGIVFGENLDSRSKEKFIQTGVLHVVAASGMNVSMLTSFLLGTLIIFLRRQYALLMTSIIVLFYVALADFQPSIVRAGIMGLFAFGAGLVGRQNTSILALFFTAFVMLFWDPRILTSISFILSFSATLGIILLDPILKRGLLKHSFFEDFRTTISAQAATTPILMFFFGTYSPISIIVNFLVLWTVPPLMVLGGAAAVLSLVYKTLALPLIYLAAPLLSYFQSVVDFFAKDVVSIETNSIPWSIVAGYYLILLSGIMWIYKRRSEKLEMRS